MGPEYHGKGGGAGAEGGGGHEGAGEGVEGGGIDGDGGGGGVGGAGGGESMGVDGMSSPTDDHHPDQSVQGPGPGPGLVQGSISPISASNNNSNVTTARRSKSRQTSITQAALTVANFVTTTTMKLGGGHVASPTPSVTGE